MTKKIAVINDLSGFGRCSLTAAISVLSAMGVQACPLPTAILTAQTGYPSYYCDDYTNKMPRYIQEWTKMNAHFDGIYTGFVANELQIEQIFSFLDSFYIDDTFLLADPVMGDNGQKYDMFTNHLCSQMKLLAKKADVITPNLTELCLLTDTDYQTVTAKQGDDLLFSKIDEMGKSLCESGTGAVIVTGIEHLDPETHIPQMSNLYITNRTRHIASFPYIGGSYSGTGDLFASVLAAGIARGESITSSIALAGKFLEAALRDSVKEQIPRNDGVNYEKYLSLLIPKEILL